MEKAGWDDLVVDALIADGGVDDWREFTPDHLFATILYHTMLHRDEILKAADNLREEA